MPPTPESTQIGWLRVLSWLIAAIPAGSGQGKVAIPIFQRLLADRQTSEATARMRGGARFCLCLSDRTQALAFLTRDYDPRLVRYLQHRLVGGDTVLDVGAHVGLVSLNLAARFHGRPVSIHAFEPDTANAHAFRTNLRQNQGHLVTLNELAIGDRVGTATLERSADPRDTALGRVLVEGEHQSSSGRTVVKMTTIDRYLEEHGISQVAVLKVDAEGFEPAVLKGARESLEQGRIATVVCEANQECLARNGWNVGMLRDMLEPFGYMQVAIPRVGLRRLFLDRHRVDADMAFELAGT